MRNDREMYRNRDDREEEPRWLHEQRHGNRSDRGNYTTNSHFNAGYDIGASDPSSFNTNEDHSHISSQGRFQAGGATYSGDNFTQNREFDGDNMYGVTYMPDDDHNSYRHYDARADYRNSDYGDFRQQGPSRERYGMPDERFSHDVSRRNGQENEYMGRSSMGDYESYRRYEQDNRMYDNDYSTGFAGRNHTPGRDHYGEDSHFSNLDRWQHENSTRDRDNRNNR